MNETASAAPRRAIVVVDLTANTKDPDATQVMSFRAAQIEGGPSPNCTAPAVTEAAGAPATNASDALNQLAALVACASESQSINARAEAARRVLAVAKANSDKSSLRVFSTKGERVQVVVIDTVSLLYVEGAESAPFLARGPKPSVQFTEKERALQIVSDLKTLARLVPGVLRGAEAALVEVRPEDVRERSGLWLHPFDRTLTLTRATLSIAATAGRTPALLAAQGLTTEQATEFLARWDAFNAERGGIDCAKGVPSQAAHQRMPFAVLLCTAVVDYTSPRGQETTRPSRDTPRAPEPEAGSAAQKIPEQTALRIEAIEGLGRLGDPRAVPHLVRLSQAPTEPMEIRESALKSLSQMKPAAAPSPSSAQEDRAAPKADLLTGPKEHWFLSASVPLTKASAFKLDEKTDQVVLDDEPSAFYLGINFLVGDLADDKRSLLDNLVLIAMLKMSKHPLDSLGAGLGLRGQYLRRFGLNLDVLTPFVGWTFTKEATEENGAVSAAGSRNSEFRFGVSLNLDQALKWVGGK